MPFLLTMQQDSCFKCMATAQEIRKCALFLIDYAQNARWCAVFVVSLRPFYKKEKICRNLRVKKY